MSVHPLWSLMCLSPLPLSYLLIHSFIHPSVPSSPCVMTSLQNSQEADSPLLLLSSSAPGLVFYLSSTFTPLLSVPLFTSTASSLIHPCHGPLVTCQVVTMVTHIQARNPWETPLDSWGSPESRGESRVLTQLW